MLTHQGITAVRHHQKQRGIAIFTVLLAVVAIMGALAVIANSNGSLQNASNGQSQKIAATGIINQGGTLASAFHNMEARGITASTVTHDMNATTGIFHPTVGTTTYVRPPASVFVAGVPSVRQAWVYKGGAALQGNGIGTAAAEYAFVLRGLTRGICEEINNHLYGSTVIPATTNTAATFVADAATDAVTPITDTTAVNMSAVAGVSRWMSGCVASSDTQYVYFVVAEPG